MEYPHRLWFSSRSARSRSEDGIVELSMMYSRDVEILVAIQGFRGKTEAHLIVTWVRLTAADLRIAQPSRLVREPC